MTALAAMIAMTMISASGGLAPKALATSRNRVNLSPKGWPAREYARFMEAQGIDRTAAGRSEEHTSELQSLMRISYAVFCLKKKKNELDTLEHTSIRTNR